ncbi:MAG: integrase core domain-containing protein [Vicinamibacterales bacterium]
MAWRTFVRAHWPALVAADFFTTEVWTPRGLVTYFYTAFLIELQSRRVQVLGSTPYPDEAFVIQCLRSVSSESDALLQRGRILVWYRDPKWSRAVEQWLSTAGVRVIRTPPGAPNCNAHAERFVRSVKEECLHRVVPLGEWHLRRTLREFITHYHRTKPPRPCERTARRSSCRTTERCRASSSASRWNSQLLLPVSRIDQRRDPSWDRNGARCFATGSSVQRQRVRI